MRTTLFALLLGCFVATGTACAARPEPVNTATEEPSDIERFERMIWEALPSGALIKATRTWLTHEGANFDRSVGSEYGSVLWFRLPSRHCGLAVARGSSVITTAFDRQGRLIRLAVKLEQ